MGDVIWINRFRDKPVDNPYAEILDQTQYWNNVVCIPTQLNLEQAAISEIELVEQRVIEIIDNIINLWIEDYKNYLEEKGKNSWNRNLLDETTQIWDEMIIKAQAIEEALDFVKENDWDIEIEDWYLFWAIEWVLANYRERVFDKLVENEWKIKSKNKTWK